MKPLVDILGEIQRQQEINPHDLLPHLSLEQRADRCAVNIELAQAYLNAGLAGRAKVFAERALLLSDFSEQVLPLYVGIQNAVGDAASIRAAYKRVGMKFATAGNIIRAIEYFNLSNYAFHNAGRGDTYEYDLDVLDKIRELARPFCFGRRKHPVVVRKGERTRVAYLVFGATHSESVLIKLLCHFGRHHDPEQFDVRFYVPNRLLPTVSPETIEYNSLRRRNIENLEYQGAHVVAPASTDALECLFDTAKWIDDFRPHLLVTTAALADLGHYFIQALQPAPVTIGLCYGPPQQYSPPDLDWVISAGIHPLIDNPCSGSLIPIELDAPDPAVAYNRSDFGIPERSVVILCAGRPEKLKDHEYWTALFRLLREHLDVFLVVVGLAEEPPFLPAMIKPDVKERFLRFGWRTDYIKILGLVDILVDTFPSGGGITLFDAMALGKPVISFHNDYMRLYSQAEWSVGDEWVEDAEVLVARGDFDQFHAVVSRLIEDPDFRARIGAQCRETVMRSRGDPERMVRRHEQVYRKVIEIVATRARAAPATSRVGSFRGMLARRLLLLNGRIQRHRAFATAGRGARYAYSRLSTLWPRG